LAVELHGIYPEIKSELEQLTGWRIDFTPTFLLVSHSNFLGMVETKNLVAFASVRTIESLSILPG